MDQTRTILRQKGLDVSRIRTHVMNLSTMPDQPISQSEARAHENVQLLIVGSKTTLVVKSSYRYSIDNDYGDLQSDT